MTDNDAPDIPPALTDSQWATVGESGVGMRAGVVAPVHMPLTVQAAVRGVSNMLLITLPDGRGVEIGDVDDLAKLIAVANEVLRRCDDPRAIMHDHLGLLRDAQEIIEIHQPEPMSGLPDHQNRGLAEDAERYGDIAGRLHELADALESYLPPAQ